MNDALQTYFTEVQRLLHHKGQPVAVTPDESDIVDDYENQQFSAEACADHIAAERGQEKIG